jgi:hypothetical protein
MMESQDGASVWLLAKSPRSADPIQQAKAVLWLDAVRDDREYGYTPVFTNRHTAEVYLSGLKDLIPAADFGFIEPIRFPAGEFAVLAVALKAVGRTFFIVNPTGEPHDVRISLAELLQNLLRAAGG